MFSEPVNESVWRSRALDRNLGRARARSVERLERLVGAARELANESGSAAFTVQQVCTRSGVSLKGFYGCFAGKDDLLIALLEEDSAVGVGILREIVERHDEPGARVHAYVTGLFEMLTIPGALGYAGVLVREQRRLVQDHADDMRVAVAPLLDLLATEIAAASAAGVVDSADPARDAQTIFALILEGIHDVTIGRADPLERAAYLWRFCFSALRGSPDDRAPKGRT